MSWDMCDYGLVTAILDVLTESNEIERAKLAEMRAARMLAALDISCKRGSIPNFEDIDNCGEHQDTADKLTAEVLGEDAPDTEVKS